MRKLLFSTLFALAMASTSGCKEPDPYAYETHIEAIRSGSGKGAGFAGLKDLVKTVIGSPDNGPRLQEFVDKVLPVFEENWDSSPEHQVNMLEMMRDIGRPEAAPLWNKALGSLDGSEEGRKRVMIALQGIQRAKATATVDAVIALLDQLTKDPSKDKGKTSEGEIRVELIRTLGILKDPKAVEPLLAILQQTTEMRPPVIHRAAAQALGQLRDPRAIDPLIVANFSIADEVSTTNLGNRVKLALVGIGEPAVQRLGELVAGQADDSVIKKVVEKGADIHLVRFTAAIILGSLGSPAAVDTLIKYVPEAACKPLVKEDPKKKKKKKDDEEVDEETLLVQAQAEELRNGIVTSLGLIGDPKGAAIICQCSAATNNYTEQEMAIRSLGYLGTEESVKCLANFVKTAESDPETLGKTDQTPLSIRVEAGRFLVMGATPDQLALAKEAFAANTDAKVKEGLAQWEPGIQIAETCKADKACYTKTLKDPNANWFAREKSAYELVRLAPGDVEVAKEISRAFKVREAAARVTMAWLVGKTMQGKKCQECADILEDVMKGEKGSTDITLQPAVLAARDTIARVSE